MKEFIKQMLGETGAISFARCISLLIVAVVLSWDTSYVWTAHYLNMHLQSGVAPVPLLPETSTLLGQIAYMTAFYGLNKGSDVLKGDKQEK